MLATSKEDFESACRVVRDTFEVEQQLRPFAFLRYTGEDGQVQRRLVDSEVVGLVDGRVGMVQLPSRQFIELMRRMAEWEKADLYMMASEANIATSTAKTKEQLLEEVGHAGGVANMPNSIECVLLHLEDKQSCEIWSANIVRGDKTAKLTEFRQLPGDTEGALTKVLPHLQVANCN